jgi:hypothetical protein
MKENLKTKQSKEIDIDMGKIKCENENCQCFIEKTVIDELLK